jgi:hypothetical protein
MDEEQPVHDARPGSPLTRHLDLSWEQAIVWVRGAPGDYPYLREASAAVGSRTRWPGRWNRPVVAYAALRPDAPHNGHRGYFERRVWRFRDGHDPYPAGRSHPNYENIAPMEAVKPHSIAAGKRSIGGRE